MVDDTRAAPYALIVDDNPVILLHAADMLEEAGFCTFAAADADIALDCLGERAGQIALLFTNVKIPGALDGFALARYAADRWPDTGILISSGEVEAADGAMPTDASFLSKPYTPEDVLAAIRRVLDVKRPDIVKNLVLGIPSAA